MNVQKEQAALERLPVNDLRSRYSELYGDETRTGNKTWLVRRILWRMQALAEGDLSERARQRASELANDDDLRLSPPKAKPAPERAVNVQSPGNDRLPLPGTIRASTLHPPPAENADRRR